MNLVVRQGRASDLPYVMDSWVTNAARHLKWSIRSLKAYAAYRIRKSKLVVACLPDDTDAIMGYAVLEGSQVHMAYVRSSARRLGVITAIFNHESMRALA